MKITLHDIDLEKIEQIKHTIKFLVDEHNKRRSGNQFMICSKYNDPMDFKKEIIYNEFSEIGEQAHYEIKKDKT